MLGACVDLRELPRWFISLIIEFFNSWDFVHWSSTCRRIRALHIETKPYLCCGRLHVKHITDIRGSLDWDEAIWRCQMISPASVQTIDIDSAGFCPGLVATWRDYRIEDSGDGTLQIVRTSDNASSELKPELGVYHSIFPDGTSIRLRQTSSVTVELSCNGGAWNVIAMTLTEDCGTAAIAFFDSFVRNHQAFPCLESVRFMRQRLLGDEVQARRNLGNRMELPPDLVPELLRKAPKLRTLKLWHIDLIEGYFRWDAMDVRIFFDELPEQHLCLQNASWCFPHLDLDERPRLGEDVSSEIPEWLATRFCCFPRMHHNARICSLVALRKLAGTLDKMNMTNLKQLTLELNLDDSGEVGTCVAFVLSKCPHVENLTWQASCTDAQMLAAFADSGFKFPSVVELHWGQPFRVEYDRVARARTMGRATQLFPRLKTLQVEEYHDGKFCWNESATVAFCEEIKVNHTLERFEFVGSHFGATDLEGQAISQLLIERLPSLQALTISASDCTFLRGLKHYLEVGITGGQSLPKALTRIQIVAWSSRSEHAKAIEKLAADLSSLMRRSHVRSH